MRRVNDGMGMWAARARARRARCVVDSGWVDDSHPPIVHPQNLAQWARVQTGKALDKAP